MILENFAMTEHQSVFFYNQSRAIKTDKHYFWSDVSIFTLLSE